MIGTTRLLVLVACASAATAQEVDNATTLRFTLDEALARAREHSSRLAQARALAEGAGAALRAARGARLPQVDLSAGYARNSDVPELVLALPGQAARTIFPNIPDTFRTRAALALPLFTAGRLEANVTAARAQGTAARDDLEAAASDLALETASAYWALLTGRESERVLGVALRSFEQHLADVRHREELGLCARNEVLAVQVERDRAELARVQGAHGAAVAEANLARLIGAPPGARIEPADAATPPAAVEHDLSALAAEAVAARPELRALRQRVEAAAAGVRAQRAATRPQLGLAAGYDYARPNPRVLPLADEWQTAWSAGVNLSWNVFDGGRGAAAVAQARTHADALRAQLQDAEERVRLEVTQRVLEVRSSRAALDVAERALAAAAENLRVAADRHREGVGSSSERLDAESAWLRAGLDHTSAAAQVQVSLAGLRRAVGQGALQATPAPP